MTIDFFPPDVRLRLEGDKDRAEELYGEARNLFHRANLVQQGRPSQPVRLVKYLDNGGIIDVFLLDTQKIITIRPPAVFPKYDQAAIDELSAESFYVLCGIKRDATTVNVAGTNYLRTFRPTLPTSAAYNIPNSYSDNKRLANTEDQQKAGRFSGAMKRVVAAIEGLGHIRDSSGQYLTGEPTRRLIVNRYLSNNAVTHGIIKSGNKNHWLVEISAQRGVLAMPLPLIRQTTTAAYEKYLIKKKDTGGLTIVREFGGIPSGETFPENVELETAITNKKVLRLMTAADLNPYFGAVVGGNGDHKFSWAFPETHGMVRNVRFVFTQDPGDPKASLKGQRWLLNITLSAHNKAALLPDPVGTGSAYLVRETNGKISRGAMETFWGGENTDQLTLWLGNYAGLPKNKLLTIPHNSYADYDPTDGWSNDPYTFLQKEWTGWGADLYVFYRGDILERVTYTPFMLWAIWTIYSFHTAAPCPGVGNGPYAVLGPWWTDPVQFVGYHYTPGAIITTSADLRKDKHYQFNEETDGWYAPCGRNPSSEFYDPTPAYDPNDTMIIPSNIEEYIATWMEANRGTAFGADHNTQVDLFALIPGFCREGVLVCRAKYDTGIAYTAPYFARDNAAVLVTAGLGVRNWDMENLGYKPDIRYPVYFGVNINPGPTPAYIITDRLAIQRKLLALPEKATPYRWSGLLPDTDAISGELTGYKVTFTGSY